MFLLSVPALVVGHRFSSAMIGLFLLALLLTYVFPAALPGVLIKPGYQQSSTPLKDFIPPSV